MIRVGYKYKARFVKRFQTKNGTAISVNIGDKIKDSDGQYWNVRLVMWNDVEDLFDEDYVMLHRIDGISASQNDDGRIFYEVTGAFGKTSDTFGSGDRGIEPRQYAAARPAPAGRRESRDAPSGYTPDDDISLPFDLD